LRSPRPGRREHPMSNYDISHLPPPVQAALLQLTAALVQAWAAPETWRSLPPELRCAYGTVVLPPDAASALPAPPRPPLPTGAPRALPAARGAAPPAGRPRDPTRAVLEVLETLFPRAVTAAELAPLLGPPREKISPH